MTPDLRLGGWANVLGDVEADALITDPPYSPRTHDRQHKRRQRIGYAAWDALDVQAFVGSWRPRVRGWWVILTDHVLARAWEKCLLEAGLYVFAPLPCVMRGMTVRMSGDGPSSWCVWAMVARPRTREMARWGTLPGAYEARPHREEFRGSKPLALMRALVRDYSRPGDLIVDPCAGLGTTMVAAVLEGRRSIGAEIDPVTRARALERVTQAAYEAAPLPTQEEQLPLPIGGS